jgi:hypothetical protein
MPFNFVGDTIRGNMGSIFITIDGNMEERNGVNFSAEVSIDDVSRAEMGNIVRQHKPGLQDISGSFELYTGNPVFLQALRNYKLTRKQPVMSIVCENFDEASDVPRKTVAIYGIQFTSFPIASLDIDADLLQDSYDFVANDYEIL